MKPSQIRVFDGLRITTEHVNHLQGAFYSGLEDFREILGLGKAQVGLEVTSQDDGSVIVQPGLAFDFEKNRVPVDAPQTIKLDFAAPDEIKYICLKHAQVDEGAVEGHPTMIWDSSTVVVRTAMPDEKENLVALAHVTKDADGKLHVCPLECVCPHAGEVEQAAEQSPAPPPASSGETPETQPTPLPEPPAPAALSPAVPPKPAVQLKQGVVQLKSDPGANLFLKTVLAPALRKKIGPDPIDLSFTLSQADLNPEIAVAGFATHCLLTAELTLPTTLYRLRSTAHGEATVTSDALVQFGASSMQAYPVPAQTGTLWSGSDFSGRGVAQFTFGQWLDAPENARPSLAGEIFLALELLIQLERTPNGFQHALKLLWHGKASEETAQALEKQDLGFTWGIIFGWKAIGT